MCVCTHLLVFLTFCNNLLIVSFLLPLFLPQLNIPHLFLSLLELPSPSLFGPIRAHILPVTTSLPTVLNPEPATQINKTNKILEIG